MAEDIAYVGRGSSLNDAHQIDMGASSGMRGGGPKSTDTRSIATEGHRVTPSRSTMRMSRYQTLQNAIETIGGVFRMWPNRVILTVGVHGIIEHRYSRSAFARPGFKFPWASADGR